MCLVGVGLASDEALYFYSLDPEFGLPHVRLLTRFPFTVQTRLNGHDWLAGKLDRHGIGYHEIDKALVAIDDPARAQRFANAFVKRNWPRTPSAFAERVNPLMNDLLSQFWYYRVIDTAKPPTDMIFRDPKDPQGFYRQLLKHAVVSSAEHVMTFLGRKLHPAFAGEVITDFTRRWPVARIHHQVQKNRMKMYDEFGWILRIETVVNNPSGFKIRRRQKRRGKPIADWFPLRKGVADLGRYAEIAWVANPRYLEAFAVAHNPAPMHQRLSGSARSVRVHTLTYRGFNPVASEDL